MSAEFWGNASWRAHQIYGRTKRFTAYAMRYWKRRGATMFDWGGGGDYKEKYGVERFVPWFYKSRVSAPPVTKTVRNTILRDI
jgi:hypothetical protein